MTRHFRPCSIVLCLAGLVACSQTPAQTADDHADVASQTSVSATEPTMTPASMERSSPPLKAAPDAALATTNDGKAPDTGMRTNELTPPAPAAAPMPPSGAPPDNTKVNKRDNDSAALTPMDQGNGQSDLKITQQIRQAVMADGSLSFTAKNVKIITVKGKVTLRGPVNNDGERSAIEAAARKVAGAQVDNQIEVKK